MKKYEFTGKTKKYSEKILHEIRAVRTLHNARIGDIGGWIESEDNLSHEGHCWIEKEAIVWNHALVRDDAYVSSYAIMSENAIIEHDSRVGAYARIDGNVHIEYGYIGEYAHISGNAHISCGQDGPPVYPYSVIDFDVSYGNEYVLFAIPHDWNGKYIALSRSGRICMEENGRVWGGNIHEFRKKREREFGEYEEMKKIEEIVGILSHTK